MDRAYNIGQVIFIASQKSRQVIPVQVVERIVKSTLQGEEVIYKVVGPNGEGPHELSMLDGEQYTDPNVIRDTLRRKAYESIDNMIDKATKVATSKFKVAPEVMTQDGGLVLKQSNNDSRLPRKSKNKKINGQPATAASEQKVTLDVGEIELPPGPDGKPRKARVRSVSESPAQQ